MRVENQTLYFRVPEFEAELELRSYDREYICHVQKAWVEDGRLELGEKREFEAALDPKGIEEPRKWTVGEGDVNIFRCYQMDSLWTIDMAVPGRRSNFLSISIWGENQRKGLSEFEYDSPPRFDKGGDWLPERCQLPGRSGDFVTVTDTTYTVHVSVLETGEVEMPAPDDNSHWDDPLYFVHGFGEDGDIVNREQGARDAAASLFHSAPYYLVFELTYDICDTWRVKGFCRGHQDPFLEAAFIRGEVLSEEFEEENTNRLPFRRN